MYWGGLRGAVSLALALTLASSFDSQTTEILQVMTFGVVLFTLLVQGTTISRLIKRLGLAGETPVHRGATAQAGHHGCQAGWPRRTRQTSGDRACCIHSYGRHLMTCMGQISPACATISVPISAITPRTAKPLCTCRRELISLNAERSALLDAQRRGLISAEVTEEDV